MEAGRKPRRATIKASAGECDAEAYRGKTRAGASPAPTMTRLGWPIRIMVGVPLAGTRTLFVSFANKV